MFLCFDLMQEASVHSGRNKPGSIGYKTIVVSNNYDIISIAVLLRPTLIASDELVVKSYLRSKDVVGTSQSFLP